MCKMETVANMKGKIKMLSLEEIIAKLEDRNKLVVSEKTGISYRSILNLFSKKHTPRYNTLKQLSDYLEKEKGNE